MHSLGNPEDNVMYIPGSVLVDYPGPVKGSGFCQTQDLGKVFQNEPIGADMLQKFLQADNFVPRHGYGGGGKRRLNPSMMGWGLGISILEGLLIWLAIRLTPT